jgi:hypothetical protein|tara:strand:- start:5271 stop:6038 length:768 start_codon:yes stop_codon:yes gene_type:complete
MWNEIVKNEVWEYDNFLHEETVEHIKHQMFQSGSTELAPGEAILPNFRNSGVNATTYNYTVHRTDIHKNKAMIDLYMDKINEVLEPLTETPVPKTDLEGLQLFTKSFSKRGWYDLHTEPINKYGPYAFMHFLSDEIGGHLVFPSRAGCEKHLENYPAQKSRWEDNIKLVESKGYPMRYLDDVVIKPQKNKCVVFAIGSAHYVTSLEGEVKENARPVVTGWPYATKDLIDGLDKHCNFNYYFDAEKHSQPKPEDCH